MRSYEKTGVLEEIRAAGGQVFGVTSEPHSLAVEAEAAWDMSIEVIGDPHHELRHDLSERGWLDIFYNQDYGHLRARNWASHPLGYYQPAVIAVENTERVLYRWRCVPKYSNMSGAGGRPEAIYTWSKIRAARSRTNTQALAELDRNPPLGSKDLSWPKFLLMLIGHGWFLRPKAFPLMREGDKDQVTPKQAMTRWYYFIVGWLVAIIIFPPIWVTAALCLWLVAMTPGLVEIHKQFQNEPDPY